MYRIFTISSAVKSLVDINTLKHVERNLQNCGMTRHQDIHLALRRNIIADAVVLYCLHLHLVCALCLIVISNGCFVIKKIYSFTKLEILMR